MNPCDSVALHHFLLDDDSLFLHMLPAAMRHHKFRYNTACLHMLMTFKQLNLGACCKLNPCHLSGCLTYVRCCALPYAVLLVGASFVSCVGVLHVLVVYISVPHVCDSFDDWGFVLTTGVAVLHYSYQIA